MTTKNDITGDSLVSKTSTDAYREGYDRIFGARKLTSIPIEVVHKLGEVVEVTPAELEKMLMNEPPINLREVYAKAFNEEIKPVVLAMEEAIFKRLCEPPIKLADEEETE